MTDNKTVNCDTCTKYKKSSASSVVGFSLASDFNQTVVVDLHQLEPSLWYLYIIDGFSRFSADCIMNTKQSLEFVKNVIWHWISTQRLFRDLGKEFDNAEVRDMAENFNMDIITTAGYSLQSNGLLERHNQALTEILLKLKPDYNLDWEIAMNLSLIANYSLQNVNGYNPYQMVLGRKPNIPSVLND